MKHEKKHKKKKSTKSSKKSKKSDRKDKKQKHKEKKKRDKRVKETLKTFIEQPPERTNQCAPVDTTNESDDYCGPPIGMMSIFAGFFKWDFKSSSVLNQLSDLMNRAKCPETKAEYDHRQNQMKRVVDPETGRIR